MKHRHIGQYIPACRCIGRALHKATVLFANRSQQSFAIWRANIEQACIHVVVHNTRSGLRYGADVLKPDA